MPVSPAFLLLACLGLVNLFTFFAFWLDKGRARRDERRIPERVLLWLAFWGGSPAAKAAQVLIRHKTRKQPFGWMLNAILVLQIAAGGWLFLSANPAITAGWVEAVTSLVRTPEPEPERILPRRFGPGS